MSEHLDPTKTEILLYLATQVMGWRIVSKGTLDGLWSEKDGRTKMIPGSLMHEARKKIKIHDEPGDGYLWDPMEDAGDMIELLEAARGDGEGFGVEIIMPTAVPYRPWCTLTVGGLLYASQWSDSLKKAATYAVFNATMRASKAFEGEVMPKMWQGDKRPKKLCEIGPSAGES